METVEITTKAYTLYGRKYPAEPTGWKADIEKGQSIRIYGFYDNSRPFDVTLKIGDVAEYDSWNVGYHGTISNVTTKRVTISDKYEKGKTYSLDLAKFVRHNWDINDLDAIKRDLDWTD
jgi:hypothetical protein